MNTGKVFRIRIDSIRKMNLLGEAFGSMFIRPLLDSGIPELGSLVVGTYGGVGVGKSTFLFGCSEGLYIPYDWDFRGGAVPENIYDPYNLRVGSKVYRKNDFDSSIIGENWNDQVRIKPRNKLKSRGVDLFEHAPLIYLNSPGAIVAIIEPGWSSSYLEDRTSRVPGGIGKQTPREAEIWDFLQEQFTLAKKAATQREVPVPYTDKRRRIVSIYPTLTHEVAQVAFADFRGRLKDYFASRP